MKKLLLLSLLSLSSAQALEVRVFEPTLERVIGYGKLSGNTLNMWLLKDASGPAVVFFVGDDQDVESYKASVEKNAVSFFRTGAQNSAVTLKAYAESKGWTYALKLVAGQTLPAPADSKK